MFFASHARSRFRSRPFRQEVSAGISQLLIVSHNSFFFFDSGHSRRHTLDRASDRILAWREAESRAQDPHPLYVFCEHGHQRRHHHTCHIPLRTRYVGVHLYRAHQGEYPSDAYNHTSDVRYVRRRTRKQTAFSVMVSNLLVIVTFIYRVVRRASGVVRTRSRIEFTTIELSPAAYSLSSLSTQSSTWSYKSTRPLDSALSSVTSRDTESGDDSVQHYSGGAVRI